MRKLQSAACLFALGAVTTGARSANAQAAASASPFHAGQWGLEGYVVGQGGGVLRFFTPRTALLLTLSTQHLEISSGDRTVLPTRTSGTLIDGTLGFRRHSMIAPHIASTLGAGVIAGTVQQRQEYPPPAGTNKFRSSHIGAFIDLGGQYMVADHFAVGLAYRFSAQHIGYSGPSSGSEIVTGFLPIRATLYF
jgi:hypothetical protein